MSHPLLTEEAAATAETNARRALDQSQLYSRHSKHRAERLDRALAWVTLLVRIESGLAMRERGVLADPDEFWAAPVDRDQIQRRMSSLIGVDVVTPDGVRPARPRGEVELDV